MLVKGQVTTHLDCDRNFGRKVETKGTTPEMCDPSEAKVLRALRELGRNPDVRAQIVSALKAFECSDWPSNGRDIREEITGPILDALYADAGELTKELQSGLKFTFRHRGKILRDFILSRSEKPDHVWEPQTTRVLLDLARGAKNVAIGGAYIGDHAILIANAIKSHGGICHCFELDDDNIRYLGINASHNGLSNIVINKLALWHEDQVKLHVVGDDAYASTVPLSGPRDGVSSITLDRYGCDNGIERFDLIMLDIEGSEHNALLGAESYLRMEPDQAPHLVFEIHGSYVDFSAGLPNTRIMSDLKQWGYHAFAIRDYQSNVSMAGRMIELVDLESVYLEGPPHGFNVVAVKRTAALNRYRLTTGVSPKLLAHKDPALHSPLS